MRTNFHFPTRITQAPAISGPRIPRHKFGTLTNITPKGRQHIHGAYAAIMDADNLTDERKRAALETVWKLAQSLNAGKLRLVVEKQIPDVNEKDEPTGGQGHYFPRRDGVIHAFEAALQQQVGGDGTVRQQDWASSAGLELFVHHHSRFSGA